MSSRMNIRSMVESYCVGERMLAHVRTCSVQAKGLAMVQNDFAGVPWSGKSVSWDRTLE